MAAQPVKGVVRHVKPLLSTNKQEARRRVLNLYKAYCKELPTSILYYHIPVPYAKIKEKLKHEFLKHKNVTDIRVIDMLVIKGQMEFEELHLKTKQLCQIMYHFKDTQNPVPKDFISKFINGSD